MSFSVATGQRSTRDPEEQGGMSCWQGRHSLGYPCPGAGWSRAWGSLGLIRVGMCFGASRKGGCRSLPFLHFGALETFLCEGPGAAEEGKSSPKAPNRRDDPCVCWGSVQGVIPAV